MNLREYVIQRLDEGGNISVNGISAEKVYFSDLGISDFRSKFFELFKELNKIFYKKYKEYLWEDLNDIKTGFSYNGSTSFIMNPKIPVKEILKCKKASGDIDITISQDHAKKLFFLLKELEGKTIKEFLYIGNNRNSPDALGDQINSIFQLKVNQKTLNIQVDFELVEYSNGRPTEWSKFSKSSSFDDAKQNIKGVFHKLLLAKIIHTLYQAKDVIIATPASTWDKIRIKKTYDEPHFKKLSYTKGLGTGIQPLLDPDGNQVYYEGKRVFKEENGNDFINDVNGIFLALFKGKGSKSNIWSYIGVCTLLRELDKNFVKAVLDKFLETLFGEKAARIEKTKDEDYTIKVSAYKKFVEITGISSNRFESMVKRYYELQKDKFK